MAGLEALIALREHLGGTVHIDLLDPSDAFAYRPMAVAEPFGRGAVRRFDLGHIAADHGATHVADQLASVDPERRVVATARGRELAWDRLVVATGARAVVAIPGALTFRGPEDADAFGELLRAAESGAVSRLAFVVPVGVAWALSAYELALLTADHLAERKAATRLVIVTSERVPLAAFGRDAGERFAGVLAERGIEVRAGVAAETFEAGVLRLQDEETVDADRVVALPRLAGRQVPGLPHDTEGFIPTDRHGAVPGAPGVYAAGDGTTFPLKQGGIAAQQADVAAAAIAADLGAPVEAPLFKPVLRALLLDAHQPRFLRADPHGDRTRGAEVSAGALWWPPSKVAARYLAPYLADPELHLASDPLLEDRRPSSAPDGQLDAEHHDVADLALTLADENARWGEYRMALRCLDAVETLEGMLPAGYAGKRRDWEARLHPGARRA